MLKFITLATVATLAIAVTVTPKPALADNGQIAAGVVGGLAVGAIVGSQLNNNRGYGYAERPYRARYRECHIERRDFEDRFGRLHVRRVRVCD